MAQSPTTASPFHDGIQELTTDVSSSPYYNHDMAPTTRAERRWGMKDIAVLWISMSACVTTYTLASQQISAGMNWWQAVLTIFLGNVIVLISGSWVWGIILLVIAALVGPGGVSIFNRRV